MLTRDRLYLTYKDKLEDVRLLFDTGLEKFITHKRYLNLRQKYLEVIASLPNKELDARVNSLLQDVHGGLPNLKKEINIMKNKERSPRKEKKKQKKEKRINYII